MKCLECGSTEHEGCGLIDHGGGGAMLPSLASKIQRMDEPSDPKDPTLRRLVEANLQPLSSEGQAFVEEMTAHHIDSLLHQG